MELAPNCDGLGVSLGRKRDERPRDSIRPRPRRLNAVPNLSCNYRQARATKGGGAVKSLIYWLVSVDWLNVAGVFATVMALGLSLHFWRRQFRPIITAMVETHHGGNEAIAYDLVILNSGSIPAKNIKLFISDQKALEAALGAGANDENKGL